MFYLLGLLFFLRGELGLLQAGIRRHAFGL